MKIGALVPGATSPWISAGKYYSSGNLHMALDIAVPIGTPVRSPVYGTVAMVADGAHNNRPGEAIWSGKRSNYVLLYTRHKGKKASLYFQHLSPNVAVRRGQKVSPGTLLGHSGDSGNSSGPHLHYHAYWGWTTDRYRNLLAGGRYAIYPPTQVRAVKKTVKLTNAQEDRIAAKTANKILNTWMTDPAYKKGSRYYKVRLKDMIRRIASRSAKAAKD